MLQRWNLLSWSSLLYDLNDSTDSKEASDLRMYDVCEISVLLERWCLAGCPVQVNSYERTMCIGRIWSVTKDSVPSLAFVTFSHSLSHSCTCSSSAVSAWQELIHKLTLELQKMSQQQKRFNEMSQHRDEPLDALSRQVESYRTRRQTILEGFEGMRSGSKWNIAEITGTI